MERESGLGTYRRLLIANALTHSKWRRGEDCDAHNSQARGFDVHVVRLGWASAIPVAGRRVGNEDPTIPQEISMQSSPGYSEEMGNGQGRYGNLSMVSRRSIFRESERGRERERIDTRGRIDG